jgi:ankyrin repeat protein
VWLSVASADAARSDLADAAMKGDKAAVRSLLQEKADVNAAQVDGTTALHWAARLDDLETAELLIRAGANVSAANRVGATPLQLAAMNGNAAMIEKLVKAGADPNAPMTRYGDTALMIAARTGEIAAIKVLLDNGAQINAREIFGGTTALMWAVSERHVAAVQTLIDRGADVNIRSKYVPATGRGRPADRRDSPASPEQHASGELTALMFAAREDHLDSARALVAAGADVKAIAADGKDALALALFNGSYDVASFLIDNGANVNHADSWGFTPLFWAVDRRNMETAPNFPWTVTADPLPVIKQLLKAGANPNAVVNNTPWARIGREGSPRIVFATPLMRAAFSADLEVVRVLLEAGADPHIVSRDYETALMAAAGTGFIHSYSFTRSTAERLEVVRLLVDLGSDVNAADDYGITPLMAAANLGDVGIIQYLVDKGADLGAHDLGKKNDGTFGSSNEPLMAIDYAIGVGTFRPNNAVIFNEEAVKLMTRLMKEKGIKHTTSECTLRGFTCSLVDVDPKVATPAEIERARAFLTGYQVDGLAGGLQVKEQNPK